MATEARGHLRAALRLRATLTRLPRPVWLCVAVLWIALSWSLSASGQEEDDWIRRVPSFWVDFGHAPVFGALALWLALALPRDRAPAGGGAAPRLDAARALGVWALVVAYGFVDEWHQSRVPGRHPTLLDVLTDAVGAGCTLWVLGYLGRPDARERGFGLRVAFSLWLCIAAAWLATWYHTRWPEPLWPLPAVG